MKHNSKICSFVLVTSMLSGSLAAPVMAADIGKEKVYSVSNPAFFNGTTSITVPLGTKIDLGETQYRMFANDFEDGDCTQNIQIVENNYKDEIGQYRVKYQVTDSHQNVSEKVVDIYVEDRQDKMIQRTLYTLPDASNMALAGTLRGNNHDRQNLGIYLKAGQKFQIRQTNPDFGKDLRLSLDTDDSKTAKSYSVTADGTWITVQADSDCVPSIFTPKNTETAPVIEMMYGEEVESLVYYRYQDGQAEFFEEWDTTDASYAMLETDRATFLIPKKDKNSILAKKAVENSLILEWDVYKNWNGEIDANVSSPKHIAFLKGNEVKSATKAAPHYQEKALPAEFLDTDVSMTLSWNAETQQLTYEAHPVADEANIITDTFAFQPEEILAGNEAYLLISAAAGSAGTFSFELSSFENGDTKTEAFDELFAKPLGNGANIVDGNRIVFTNNEKQVGAVNTKQKMDLSRDFRLEGIVNLYHDSDGMTFTLHNDARGSRAIGEQNGALGVFKIYDGVDYNGFQSVDELLEFYNGFTENFDEYLGLAYDTDNILNQNVRTKFFVKADKHGAGAAYYGGEHTAQNGDTMTGYLSRGWLSIHEFAHGYEGRLASQELALVDVLNNVLGYYEEQRFKDPNSGGWLGKKQDIEKKMAAARQKLNNYQNYNQMEYSERLYSFVNLLDRIGSKEGMAAVHSLNREVTSAGIYYNATDLFAKGFSEYSKMNVIPYLESWKLMAGNAEKMNVYEQDFPILYYLRDCVGSDGKAVEIMNDLGCDGIYSLVTVDDLKQYQLTGNLEILLSIDDFEQIKGKKMFIKNGQEVVKEITVAENPVVVEGLSVGAYEVELPNTKQEPYLYDYQYAVVSEGQTTRKEISYEKEYNALDSDIRVDFKGLGDRIFASLTYDKKEGKVKIDTNGGQPHSYYQGTPYTQITVLRGEETLYDRTYIGNESNQNEKEEVEVKLGDKVKLWHDESGNRLAPYGELTNGELADFKAKEKRAEYIVTKYGLMPAGFSEDAMYELYQNRVENYAELVEARIPENQKDNKNAYPLEKNLLRKSIQLLKEEDRKSLEKEYEALFFGGKPKAEVKQTAFEVGDVFSYDAVLEVVDKEDGKIALDESSMDLSNVPMEDGKFTKAGTYPVSYQAADTDGNAVSGSLELVITGEEEIEEVDKGSLEKLVRSVGIYEEKIGTYTPNTAEIFSKALEDARTVLADEHASEAQVEQAYKDLQSALFGLRLIPNKDKLNDFIKKAEKVDLSQYTDDSAKEWKAALAVAKAVAADENATKEEVSRAVKALETAEKHLIAKEDKDNAGEKPDKDTGKDNTETSDKDAGKDNAVTSDKDAGKDNTETSDKGAGKDNAATSDKDAGKDNAATSDKGAGKDNAATSDKGAGKDNTETSDKSAGKGNTGSSDKGAGKDNAGTSEKTTEKVSAKSVKTGDSTATGAWAVLMAVVSACAAYFVSKRKS